ncbi:MAG TPA: hypothetical protein VLI06_17785 [Solimonas sp.]|nr:hypothetical protein [Solimonas sp.]
MDTRRPGKASPATPAMQLARALIPLVACTLIGKTIADLVPEWAWE